MTASVEYEGNFYQCKWNGDPVCTIVPGTIQFADPIYVTIPTGAKFYTRQFVTSTGTWNTCVFGTGTVVADNVGGDAFTYNAGDQTVNGTTMYDQAAGTYFLPVLCIVGPTRRPSIGIVGDESGAVPTVDPPTPGVGDMGDARGIGSSYGYIACGKQNDTMIDFIADSPLRQQILQYCSHLLLTMGRTECVEDNSTAAQLAGRVATIASFFPNALKFVSTMLPFTTSTDDWATTANQTIEYPADLPNRVAYNTLCRTGQVSGTNGYYDPCVYGEYEYLTNSGLWVPNTTADGHHFNTATYQAFGTSGLIDPHRFVLNYAR
jgi:hypothetical protein